MVSPLKSSVFFYKVTFKVFSTFVCNTLEKNVNWNERYNSREHVLFHVYFDDFLLHVDEANKLCVPVKDGASFCYCACILPFSEWSEKLGFLKDGTY